MNNIIYAVFPLIFLYEIIFKKSLKIYITNEKIKKINYTIFSK